MDSGDAVVRTNRPDLPDTRSGRVWPSSIQSRISMNYSCNPLGPSYDVPSGVDVNRLRRIFLIFFRR